MRVPAGSPREIKDLECASGEPGRPRLRRSAPGEALAPHPGRTQHVAAAQAAAAARGRRWLTTVGSGWRAEFARAELVLAQQSIEATAFLAGEPCREADVAAGLLQQVSDILAFKIGNRARLGFAECHAV